MQRLVNYLKDTRAELKHVSWPTGRQAAIYTALIIATSVIVSLIVGLFDFLFTQALDWFISTGF
jgi:preprotein translocase subunit SecE